MIEKTIVVCEANEYNPYRIQGEIDWKDQKIRVGGITRTASESIRQIGGYLSP